MSCAVVDMSVPFDFWDDDIPWRDGFGDCDGSLPSDSSVVVGSASKGSRFRLISALVVDICVCPLKYGKLQLVSQKDGGIVFLLVYSTYGCRARERDRRYIPSKELRIRSSAVMHFSFDKESSYTKKA